MGGEEGEYRQLGLVIDLQPLRLTHSTVLTRTSSFDPVLRNHSKEAAAKKKIQEETINLKQFRLVDQVHCRFKQKYHPLMLFTEQCSVQSIQNYLRKIWTKKT